VLPMEGLMIECELSIDTAAAVGNANVMTVG
jgi:delta 1-pyrroline-5-carboxylate dehydrogenase